MLMSLVISSSAFAQGETAKIDLKKAIEIAKEYFTLPEKDFRFDSNYNEDVTGIKTWSLNWNSKENARVPFNYGVSVDAGTGDITYYSSYSNYNETTKLPKYTKKEAYDKALEFIKKIQPVNYESTMLYENKWNGYLDSYYYSSSYNFNFIRYIDGVPYPENYINVSFDKNTLEIINYNYIWDHESIDVIKAKIDLEKAKSIFASKLGLQLTYVLSDPDTSDKPKVNLVYGLKRSNWPIDALTGEIIKTNAYLFGGGEDMLARAEKSKQNSSLTPEEQREVDENNNFIKKEKALEIAKKYVKLDKDYKLNYSGLNSIYPRWANSEWRFNWEYKPSNNSKKTQNRYGYVGCTIDAVTGEVKDFNIYDSNFEPQKNAKPKYNEAQAKKIAEKYLKAIQPKKFLSTEYKENDYYNNEEKPRSYMFSYIRKVNGAACPFNSFNVTVDAYSGMVTSYNMVWYNIDFPKPENVMNIEDAYKIYFDKFNFGLRYFKERSDIYYKPIISGDNKKKIKLVYMLNDISSSAYIDAKTGDVLDYNGKVVSPNEPSAYSDLEGHSAKDIVQALLDLGILKKDSDKFNPDAGMVQKDFIKILATAIQPYYEATDDEYDTYYNIAFNNKIIFDDEKNPDKVITRIEASKYLVRALKLAYLADLNTMFEPKFKDISGGELGYVSIMDGLKIIGANGGTFEPNKEVTRAQAVTFVYNYMKIDTSSKVNVIPLMK